MKSFNISAHAALHFVGSYAIALTLLQWWPMGWAFGITACLGLLWELLDAMNQTKEWGYAVLDPNGGDIVDFAVDLFGVISACLMFWTF